MLSEKRVPFSPVRERDLFFSPAREEVVIFERNMSDRSTDQKVKRKGEIMSILMLESNERKLEHMHTNIPY